MNNLIKYGVGTSFGLSLLNYNKEYMKIYLLFIGYHGLTYKITPFLKRKFKKHYQLICNCRDILSILFLNELLLKLGNEKIILFPLAHKILMEGLIFLRNYTKFKLFQHILILSGKILLSELFYNTMMKLNITREFIESQVEHFKNSYENGTQYTFSLLGFEIMSIPHKKLTMEELNEKAPLRCSGLHNNDSEAKTEYEYCEHCSICYENMNFKELFRTLPCCHSFHTNCIDNWIISNSTCPICKYNLHRAQI